MAEPDVVIVGAGAGGLAAAWRLASAGMRVVLLEAGRAYRPEVDYPQDQDDFELRGFPYDPVNDERGKPRYAFGSAQEIGPEWDDLRSRNVGQGRFVEGNRREYQVYSHVRGVGGSTLHFQGEAHRFHPDSLRMRTLFGVGADWPLSWEELDRYYTIAEERIGVAAPENPLRPGGSGTTLPPHPLSYASQRLAKGFASVGATLVPNSLAILSRPYDRRPPCNHCNSCTQGCPIGDKGSADVTFLPAALATGRLELRTQAQAVEIEVGKDGKPTAVVCQDRNGARSRIAARYLILAAGTIETPRLLLLSRSRLHPQGIGNARGQVGRNLTESLFWTSVALLQSRVDSFRGVPIDGSAWEFAVPHRGDGWIGGFRIATAHGTLELRGPAAYAQRLVPGFGRAHAQRVRETFGHAVGVLALGEWLPNENTFVDVDPWRRDSAGVPLARITSMLGDNERSLLRTMAKATCAVLSATEKAEIVEQTSALDLFVATHVLGTCRIGTDPATSVADADGFCHEVPNLAFADGSALPSSGCGDSPFLTITAMALRTADRLIDRARHG
ncbi:MAG: GMC oxidoreductase [Thermoanaerobaculales bacterium]